MSPFASAVMRRACIVSIGIGVLAGAQGASAADQLWWSNRDTASAGIVRAAMDGSGATPVLAQADVGRISAAVPDPARGKLYWIKRSVGELWSSDLDGTNRSMILSGAGNGLTPGQTQLSLSIDPASGTLYWTQADLGIRWAKADGSAAGTLYAPADVPGTMFRPFGLVVDRQHNRIWWANYDISSGGVNPAMGYANLDGSGDARALDLTCTSLDGGPTIDPDDSQGIVVDYGTNRIYAQTELAFDAAGHFMASISLDGSDCIQISPAYTPGQSNSNGLALDPDTRRLYNARGSSGMNYLDLAGTLPAPIGALPISPSSAATAARWPFIIKPPRVAGGTITASASSTTTGARLSCACETVDDQITMRVYRGARTEVIQWYRDGVEIPGATGKTLVASSPGSYTAVLRAGNVAGDITLTSNALTITAPGASGAATEADPKLTVGSAAVTKGATLTTTVNPSVAGTVRVTATLAGRGVCTTTKKATRAGRMRVTCTLSPRAQAIIKRRAVTLKVVARLTDAAGKRATASRTVKVARYVVKVPVTG